MRPDPEASVTVTPYSDRVSPTSSSSVRFTVTDPVTFPYPPPEAVWDMLAVRPSLSMRSSTPVTVTCCVWLQSSAVKTSESGETEATPVLPLARATLTVSVGSEASATV